MSSGPLTKASKVIKKKKKKALQYFSHERAESAETDLSFVFSQQPGCVCFVLVFCLCVCVVYTGVGGVKCACCA